MASRGMRVEKTTYRSRTCLNKRVALAIIGTSMVWFLVDVVAINMYAGYESTMNSKLPLFERDISGRKADDKNYRNFTAKSLSHNKRKSFSGEENLGAFKFNKKLKKPKLERLLNRQNKESRNLTDSITRLDNDRLYNDTKSVKSIVSTQRSLNSTDKDVIRNLTDSKAVLDNAELSNVTKSLVNNLQEITQGSFHYVQNLDVTTAPRNTSGPGEGGHQVITRSDDKKRAEETWANNYFNEFVSDMISVERSLSDCRPAECNKLLLSNDLPKTTVIICFCEESWSALLRTVHSVINRSPPELLEEVLLIDDFSQRDYLKKPLYEYMKRFPKVKIIRLKERYGLIRARLVGVKRAKASVLTFLDSHIECSVGWLEPLLQRIKEDRRNVVCPVIDRINSHSFGYEQSALSIGSFSWGFAFKWGTMSDAEQRRRKHPTSPVRTPTMAGGLFSIDKSFFHELGEYDEGFQVWGGENLELSFKVWMCGGQMEILPCSRVGHIFRSKQPYSFPGDDNVGTFRRNTMRLVEVWVDEPYKKLFYDSAPDMIGQDPGDLTSRRALREKLQCKDFQWYLDNVHPSLRVPDLKFQAKGEVRSKFKSTLCLDNMKENRVAVFQCHGNGISQVFVLTWRDTIENEQYCCSIHNDELVRVTCDDNTSKFTHKKGGAIVENKTGKCLEINTNDNTVTFQVCNNGDQQKWLWKYYYDKEGGLLT